MDKTQSSTPPLTGGEAQDKAEFEQEKAKVTAQQASEPRRLTSREETANWLEGGYVTLTSDVLPTETSTGAVEVVQVPIKWLLEIFYQQGRASEEVTSGRTGYVGE